ncbi:MAG: trypsin-like peptidase domain-containing protein [Deltaproteobacteria bacterium]|nr:trypsin-like peptidase domain-containing protein [Deltaproteobacteria bacterium]
MSKSIIILCVSILLTLIPTSLVFANQWADKIERLKPTVVNLEVTSEVNLGFDKPGKWDGTGFIVDGKRGIIATNRHVSSTSPASIKITFFDGSSTEGSVQYYDYYHDFAFIKFDPSAVSPTFKEAKLGFSLQLKPQQTVFLIGNNEREEYSVKIGMVVNSRVNKGDRHSLTLHTSFDRTGGSSGSPVFNEQEEVVAIHFKGTDTSSFELPIEYILDSFDAIRKGEIPQRGDIGLKLDYVNIDDAIKHAGISDDYRKIYKQRFQGATKFIHVRTVIPRSEAENLIKPGDIIWSVGDQLIGDNLYLFDKLLDKRVDQKIKLTVLRHEGKKVFELRVRDLEKEKTKRFVLFGGGTFQDITTEFRRKMNYGGDGVFMNNVRLGSSFAALGLYGGNKLTARRVIIKELNGTEIRNLEDFIKTAETIKDGTHTSIIYQDLWNENTSPDVMYTSVNLRFSPLRIVRLDGGLKLWEGSRRERGSKRSTYLK